jgi:hypothetical protein
MSLISKLARVLANHTMNLARVSMLQTSPHVIHLKRILDFGDGGAIS